MQNLNALINVKLSMFTNITLNYYIFLKLCVIIMLCIISLATPHRDCAADAQSDF